MKFKKSGLLGKIKDLKYKVRYRSKPKKKAKKFDIEKFKKKFRLKGINWLGRKKQLRLYLNKAGFDIRSDELIKKFSILEF
tara:strand:- start:9253 stop:9495 length:243 start_codon:yes stop_codon:yes gene_type:complete